MSRIIHKRPSNRCTVCKRKAQLAIAEQLQTNESCDTNDCEFSKQIQDAIEKKYRLNITPKEKVSLSIRKLPRHIIKIFKK
ncbi:MAG TPA: hypothetical protein DCG19_13955 [Cryomorphaceae bacterium]|nr:hypothetical protein [Owenweeksia sp.]MBF97838.1 hypothetical protein [Owenweeksia sp.]HAD98509.1 hypothetical protein [Cryomorphaceae bacterium]HCQ15793.1 hypothetical protein [Cryomorphaceae bacterium]